MLGAFEEEQGCSVAGAERRETGEEREGRGWQSLLATEGTLDYTYVMIEFISL